jgi:hypothetical protein
MIDAEREKYLRDLEEYRASLLAHYQDTGILTTRMVTEATLAWHPFDFMETFAPEWYRRGENHSYRRPDNFLEDLADYEHEAREGGLAPCAEGLIAYSWHKWGLNPWKPIWEDLQELNKLAPLVEKAIWRNWLQGYYQKATRTGHIATAGYVDMLVWGSAGRVMVQFQPFDAETPFISFITAEEDEGYEELGLDRPRMGIQGLHGTPKELSGLVTPLLERTGELRALIRPQGTVTLDAVAALQAQAKAEAREEAKG